jgi:hypothetical protein
MNTKPIIELLTTIDQIIVNSGRTGIVTIAAEGCDSLGVLGPENPVHSFDVDPFTLVWGHNIGWWVLLQVKLAKAKSAGLMVRTFTPRKELTRCADGKSRDLPVKELRGFCLWRERGKFLWKQLPEPALFEYCNTDPDTREPLPPEVGVVYCGV